MFLEVVTLILLTLVLLSKWWTARHTQKLSLELIELQTSHSKLKADHGAIVVTGGESQNACFMFGGLYRGIVSIDDWR